jgi:GAF domain-containing protein
MRNTNRLYAVLSHVGEAVVRIADRERLLATVCHIAVEHGNFPLAWVGLVDPRTGVVTPAAAAGPAASYLDGIRISINAEPEGRGPTGVAINEARTVVNNDLRPRYDRDGARPRVSPARNVGPGLRRQAAGGRPHSARHCGRLIVPFPLQLPRNLPLLTLEGPDATNTMSGRAVER